MLVKTQSVKHELVMPKRYTDLSEEEMEYDGGLLNFIVSAIVTGAGLAATTYGAITGNQAAKNAGNALLVVGLVITGVGTLAAVATITKTAVSATASITEKALAQAAIDKAAYTLAYNATVGVLDPLTNITISAAGK